MYKNDIFSGLSPEQEQAVCHKEGPMMVLAGPGSGKTFAQLLLAFFSTATTDSSELVPNPFQSETGGGFFVS